MLESTRRRRVLLAFVVAIALIAGPAIGYFLVFVQPGDDWFVRVNGVEVKRSVLVELLRAEQIEASLRGAPFDLAAQAFDLAAELTADEVLRQQADDFGGAVDDEAINVRLRRLLVPVASNGDPADLEETEFQELLRTYLDRRKLGEGTLRERVGAEIARERATALLASAIPRVQPHIHLHRIVTPDQGSADFVLQRANAGVAFEQLATDYSIINDDGDLDWLPYDALPVHLAEYLWGSEPFQLSPPVAEPDGTVALYVVSGRDPGRAVEPANMRVIEQRTFDAWMGASMADHEIEVRLDSEMFTWLSEQIAKTRIGSG